MTLAVGPYFVRVSCDGSGLLLGEAVSKATLPALVKLDVTQELTLRALGWHWPADFAASKHFWRSWPAGRDPAVVAGALATTLRAGYRAWPQQVTVSRAEVAPNG